MLGGHADSQHPMNQARFSLIRSCKTEKLKSLTFLKFKTVISFSCTSDGCTHAKAQLRAVLPSERNYVILGYCRLYIPFTHNPKG